MKLTGVELRRVGHAAGVAVPHVVRHPDRAATCCWCAWSPTTAEGWGECVAMAEPLLLRGVRRRRRRRAAPLPGARAGRAGARSTPHAVGRRRWRRSRATGWPRRRWRWRVLDAELRAAGRPLSPRARAPCTTGCRAGSRSASWTRSRAARRRRRLPRRGLRAHQAQDRAGLGRRAGARGARAVRRRRAAAGRRQHRLHRWPTPGTWPGSTRSTCCSSSSRWPRTTSLGHAELRPADHARRSASTSRSPRPGPRPRRSRLGACCDRQHQARPGRRLPGGPAHPRRLRRARRPGLVRRHAGDRARPGRQRRPRRAARLHPARRHLGVRPLLRAPTSPSRSCSRTATSPCPTGPASASAPLPDVLDEVTTSRRVDRRCDAPSARRLRTVQEGAPVPRRRGPASAGCSTTSATTLLELRARRPGRRPRGRRRRHPRPARRRPCCRRRAGARRRRRTRPGRSSRCSRELGAQRRRRAGPARAGRRRPRRGPAADAAERRPARPDPRRDLGAAGRHAALAARRGRRRRRRAGVARRAAVRRPVRRSPTRSPRCWTRPITIEDRSTGCSPSPAGRTRPTRPDRDRAGPAGARALRAAPRRAGVFRELYRSDQPVLVDPVPDDDGGLRPAAGGDRRACRRRDARLDLGGGRASRSSAERAEALREAAKLVALHLLRVRAGADVERRLRADLVGTALEGGAGAARGRCSGWAWPAGRSSVLALALATPTRPRPVTADGDAAPRHTSRQRLADAFAMHLTAVHPRVAVGAGRRRGLRAGAGRRRRATARPRAVRIAHRVPRPGRRPAAGGRRHRPGRPATSSGSPRARAAADRALRVLRERADGPPGGAAGRRPRRGAAAASSRDLVAARGRPAGRSGRPGCSPTTPPHGSDSWSRRCGPGWTRSATSPAAAAPVYVHPNTFRYRLRRLAEVGGLDLADPDARFAAMLQLRLVAPPSRS